jgi:hypothetical protein
MCAVTEAVKVEAIEVGDLVTWSQDLTMRNSHEHQFQRYIRECGYGPFLVKSVKERGRHFFISIAVDGREREVNSSFLQPVATFTSPASPPSD